MIRKLLLAAAVFAALAAPVLGDSAQYKTKNVIVAVMDGVRWAETFGDPNRALVPNLAAMEKDGTLCTNIRIAGPGISVTRQGHSTISTGTWQTVALAGARMTMPTFFEYARTELGWKQTDCWCVFGKGPYAYADFSSFPGYGADHRPWFIKGIGEGQMKNDDTVLETVIGAMDIDKPHLIFINFGYTDHIAHVGTYDQHKDAIRHCDEVFGKLWQKVQSTSGYKDETTVFFVNDHGRHDDRPNEPANGVQSHGDQCNGCRHIMWLAIGPDIKRGAKIDNALQQIDICPTVGELLGFQTTFSEGNVISDMLTNPLGINTKAAKTDQAKDGLKLVELSKRDLIKAVSEANLSRSSDSLQPSVETEILMRGMLKAAEATNSDACVKYVQSWVEKNATSASTDAHVARVMLELGQVQAKAPAVYDPAKVRECANKIAADWKNADPIVECTNIAFLARAGQVFGATDAAIKAMGADSKTEEQLVSEWRELGIPNTPMACDLIAPTKEETKMVDAMSLLTLSDAAAAMPTNRIVRLACSLQGSKCSQGRPELGANWSDPTVSAVIIAAIESANQLKPGIDWTKSEPAKAQMAANPAPANAKNKKKPQPPRWAQPMKTFYFDSIPWQVLSLKYQIGANGHFAKGDTMSDGAALLMLCAVRGQNLAEQKIKSFSN